MSFITHINTVTAKNDRGSVSRGRFASRNWLLPRVHAGAHCRLSYSRTPGTMDRCWIAEDRERGLQ
jgi:hypothetical protein